MKMRYFLKQRMDKDARAALWAGTPAADRASIPLHSSCLLGGPQTALLLGYSLRQWSFGSHVLSRDGLVFPVLLRNKLQPFISFFSIVHSQCFSILIGE